MSTGVEQIGTGIDELLAVDAHELDDDELHDLVVDLQCERNRLAAVAASALSVWEQRMLWATDGSRSAAARLANETSSSASSARIELRRARQLRSMPHTTRALAGGELSVDHVDLLAKANAPWRGSVFAEHEASLVEQCNGLRFADARKMVDYWCLRADSEAAEDRAERQRQASHLNVSPTLDGTVVINGTLDPISGAIVRNELIRLERELYLADQRGSVVRTAAQRRSAALVEMATRSATAPSNGRRPKALFTALVGDESVAQLCELADGTVITPGQLVRWSGDADLESVLFDGPSTVISVSHRRSFTGAVRRAVEVRDRTCQHTSGCDVPGDQCDVDHIVPYAAQGPTSQFNGKLECPPHNRDSDRHDHGGEPRPSRPVDRLDEIRCRIRWRYLKDLPADDDPDRVDTLTEHRADAYP